MVAVLLFAPSLEAQISQTTLAPSYSTASIANAATDLPSGFAPNSIISIYGSNLSYATSSVTAQSAVLPITVGGVTVYIGQTFGYIFYVSPRQINVLIPYNLSPGPTSVTVVREGTVGPTIPIVLTATAPSLFQITPNTILATHADNSLVTSSAPAAAGETIIIYAIGLGTTNPDQIDGFIPVRAAKVSNFANLNVLLNGTAVPPSNIQYAGITPGCAGLYQINLLLPQSLPSNPELRVQIGPNISPPSMILLTH
jgi:uncharacterized protein (TIGR03437 family)